MSAKLLVQLIFGVFSFERNNMRFPNVRRCLVVLLFMPIFISFLFVNRVFLLLDYLIFPFFLFQNISKPVFIVGAPRSGTTYLYHSLAAKKQDFTCFELWEIVLAPSVIQKYVWLAIIKIDKLIGGPIKWVVLKVEHLLIGNLKQIHPISINMPEEDEAILLWGLSSLLLNFFYPDSNYFDQYLRFDNAISQRKRLSIMRSYKRYVKRHNFVFNRKGNKQFLAKNPLMMCKLASMNKVFPDGVILNIIRAPHITIPSTIALNKVLYGLFTSKETSSKLNDKTKDVLIDWFKMSNETLNSKYQDRHLQIDFKKLIQRDSELQTNVSNLVGRELNAFLIARESKRVNHKSKNDYLPLTGKDFDEVYNKLPFIKNILSPQES